MRNRTNATRSQKNGVVVRQVVGHGRLVGEHAYEQLDELYRALHWYVNCFQPSMKLVSKQVEGRKIHRIYDTAKTPLQRVLLSEVFSPSQQQELRAIGKAFDPLRLFQQVDQLQQATFRCEAGRCSTGQPTPPTSFVPFDLAACVAERILQGGSEADEVPQEERKRAGVLDWRRTSKDPFAGQWEQILVWAQANPTRSSADILRELQSLFPGRYECSHLRTLQRGIHKIRTQMLQAPEQAGSPEGLGGNGLPVDEVLPTQPAPEGLTSFSSPASVGAPSPGETSTPSSDPTREEENRWHAPLGREALPSSRPRLPPSAKQQARSSGALPLSHPGLLIRRPHERRISV